MKKTVILALALTAVLACQKENDTKSVVLTPAIFSASIDEAASKVTLGDFGATSVALKWAVGDEIKLIYPSGNFDGTITAVDANGKATISAIVPDGENPTHAWYPAAAYDGGTMVIPATQTHGSLPLILEGTPSGGDISFAASASSTIVCYPLTGDIAVKEAYIYLTETPNLFVAQNQEIQPNYTLSFATPLQLSDVAQTIAFVVPTDADRVATLEIKTAAPAGALVTDYRLMRRKATALTLTDGHVKKMPTLNITAASMDVVAPTRWCFNGSKTGINDRSSNGENVYTLVDDHVSCRLYPTGTYMKLNFYLTNSLISPNKIYPGTHRYMAIKSNIVHAMMNVTDKDGGALTCGTALANFWDLRLSNAESTATPSFQFIFVKPRYRYSGEIDCGNNVKITYFDLMQSFNGYYYPTTSPIGTKGCYFVQQVEYKSGNNKVVNNNVVDASIWPDETYYPCVNLYWVGFFNSLEEIQAYEASL